MAEMTMEELEKKLYEMWSSTTPANADEMEKQMNTLCLALIDKGIRLSAEANGYATGIAHLADGVRLLKRTNAEDAKTPMTKKLKAFARQGR